MATGIEYDITADSSGLQSGTAASIAALRALDKTGKETTAVLDRLTKAMEAEAKAAEDAAGGVRFLAKDLKGLKMTIPESTKEVKKSSASVMSMGASLKGLAGPAAIAGTAITAIGVASFGVAMEANELIDRMGRLSQQTGQSVNTLLALESAAGAAGAESAELVQSLNGFNAKIREASKDGSEANKQFAELGINLKDAAGETKSADVLFREALTTIGQIGNETDRTSAAISLFGEGGTKLIGVLGAGTATLDEWSEATAKTAALVEENEEANAAWSEASTKLSNAMTDLTLIVGGELLPHLTTLALAGVEMLGWLEDGIELYRKWEEVIFPTMVSLREMSDAMRELFGNGKKLGDQYKGLTMDFVILDESSKDFGKTMSEVNRELATGAVKKAAADAKALAEAQKEAAAAAAEHAENLKLFNALVAGPPPRPEFEEALQAEISAIEKRNEKLKDYRFVVAGLPETVSDTYMDISGTIATFNAEQLDADAELTEAKKFNLMDWAQANKSTVDLVGDVWSTAYASLMEAADALTGRRLENIAKEQDATKAAIAQDEAIFLKHSETMSAKEKDILIARVAFNKQALKQQEKERKKAALTAFRVDKAAALVDIGIKTAQSIMAALVIPPPAGPILAGVNAAAGATSAALVASKAPPSFRVGLYGGAVPDDAPRLPGGQRDQRMIAAEPGEFVINPEQMGMLGGGGQARVIVLDAGTIREIATRPATRAERAAVTRSTEVGV